MQKLYELAGVTQHLSAAYHPQSHGQIEKWGGTLTRMLKAFCSEHHGNWDEAVPLLVSAYRDAVHPSLGGFTPMN